MMLSATISRLNTGLPCQSTMYGSLTMEQPEENKKPNKAPIGQRLKTYVGSHEFKLYASYGLSAWGDRLWTFGLGLALVEIGGDLRLAGISGLVNCAAVFLLAALIGRWIDRSPRLGAARLVLTVLNGSVAISALALVGLLIWRDKFDKVWNGHLSTVLIGLACVLCGVSVLASAAMKILLAGDWAVVLSHDDDQRLTRINATMLRIDLTTMIISPLVAGEIMTLVSLKAGCAFIAAWNCCSWPIEFYLLKVVYDAEPGLAKKELVQEEQKNDGRIKSTLYEAKKAWMAYGRQPVLGAAIAMALLYMTILSFDQVTNGYVYSQGVPENLLAVAQGVGSLSGILGTLIFPALRNRIGIRWAGLLSLCLELLCLSPSVVSIWLNGSPFDPDAYFSPTVSPTENYVSSTTVGENKNSKFSVIVLLGSIVSARCGLWMADLAITQLMQQAASPSERGAVFGVQSGLQQLMSMLKNAMAIALPLPSTFGILILASYSSITAALLTYILFMIRTASTASRKEKEKDHFTSL